MRNDPYCIVSIPRETLHQKIHEWLTDVPAPSEENAQGAIEQLRFLRIYHVISDDDDFGKRLIVLISLFDCVEQPTADAFRKQLDIMRAVQAKPS